MKTRSFLAGAIALAVLAVAAAVAIAPDASFALLQAIASPHAAAGFVLASAPLVGKKAMAEMIDVQATGPVRHGDAEGVVTDHAAGDVLQVSRSEAAKLFAAGAIEEPKKAKGGKAGKTDAELAAEKKAADEAAIAEANAKAEAERKAAADAEAANKG